MRIISGEKKGYNIDFPSGINIRPTTDKCRESLFNIMNNVFYFDQIRVLELFAGSGSMSLEFASRGCREIICVDNNSKFVKWLFRICLKLDYDFVEIIKTDAIIYLLNFASGPFDIIFADPPYNYKYYSSIPDIVFSKNLLSENGWLILEHDNKIDFNSFQYFSDKRNYGQSCVSIFKKSNS